MNLEYEKKKYNILQDMVNKYYEELKKDRLKALDMPIETDNGFNVEREQLIDDIDEKIEILKRHCHEPYFAKLIFKDKDDDVEFNGYIGRLSIGDIGSTDDNKIVDWRAPISDLYYNGRIGDTQYTAHGKKFNVNLSLKRQINIKDNEVKSIYDFEDAVSSDEFLKPFLAQGADNRLKSIVATIQEEQNKIIRLPLYQNCIVQGVAGSGKTTVALHRLSYLMYNYKKSIRPQEFLIISPNEIFMSYISNILIDLDADKSNSYSLIKVIQNLIGYEYKILSKHEQFNYLVKNNISYKYLSFKNKSIFKTALDNYFFDLKQKIFKKPLIINGIEVLDKETVFKYFNGREETIQQLLLHGSKKLGLALYYEDNIKNLAINNINNSNVDLQKKFSAKKIISSSNYGYIKKLFKIQNNPIKVYIDFINHIDQYIDFEEMSILKKYTLKNFKEKKVAFDDLASILYIISKLDELPYYNSIKYVFIDEAQDLSELMYISLKRIFPKAVFAIFGDISQGIYSYESIENWEQVQKIIGNSEIMYLNKSYRTSIEIMSEANKVLQKLGNPPANNVIRSAGKVEYYSNNNCEQIQNIINSYSNEYNNIAIICKDETQLKQASENLKNLNLTVIDEENISYDNKSKILLTVQTAKGLEFDMVIIYDYSSFNQNLLDLRLLYVAETRALHKLVLCSYEENNTK